MTAAQLHRQFFAGQWATYRRVRALLALALVRRDPTYYREPFVLRLTAAGARLAAIGVGPPALVLAEVRHALALVDLTERLLTDYTDATLITEREYRAARLRALRAGIHDRCGRIPDAIFHWESGARVALELDLTPKREREIRRLIEVYRALYSAAPGDDGFSAVWWYVLPSAAPHVSGIVHAAHADDIISVREWTA